MHLITYHYHFIKKSCLLKSEKLHDEFSYFTSPALYAFQHFTKQPNRSQLSAPLYITFPSNALHIDHKPDSRTCRRRIQHCGNTGSKEAGFTVAVRRSGPTLPGITKLGNPGNTQKCVAVQTHTPLRAFAFIYKQSSACRMKIRPGSN